MASSQPVPGDRASSGAVVPPVDAAMEANLMLQRGTLLYEGMPAALAAGLGCAFALVVVNWNVLPHNQLLAWLTYHVVLAAGRYLLARSFRAARPTATTNQRWHRAFLTGTTLAGVGWGASALILFPESSPTHQVFLAFVLAGVSAGASSTLSAHFDAFLSFARPTLTPLILRFLFLNHEQALPVAVCTCCFPRS